MNGWYLMLCTSLTLRCHAAVDGAAGDRAAAAAATCLSATWDPRASIQLPPATAAAAAAAVGVNGTS
jgi:hypothetical protein